PVAGSITGMRFEDVESTHSPPIKSLCALLRKRAAAAEGSGWGAIEAGEAFTTYLRTMFSWGSAGDPLGRRSASTLAGVYRTSAHFAAGGRQHTLAWEPARSASGSRSTRRGVRHGGAAGL